MANRTFENLAMETMSPESIRRSDILAHAYLVEMLVRELRQLEDMRISTLNTHVTALGGKLRISATFPNGEVILTQFDADE